MRPRRLGGCGHEMPPARGEGRVATAGELDEFLRAAEGEGLASTL